MLKHLNWGQDPIYLTGTIRIGAPGHMYRIISIAGSNTIGKYKWCVFPICVLVLKQGK